MLTSTSRSPSAIAELLVIQYRSVTDTYRQTYDDSIYSTNIASHGNDKYLEI